MAQDQTAQGGANAGAATGGNELQEVVVTAERRAEDVQSTPIAVTAVTGEQLRAQNVTKLNDLTQVAPALSITNNGGYQLVTMRGVGNSLGEDPITTGVPVILDGMANPRGTGLSFAYFDLADVELLRGPQGTYIGSNSTGGAITINSANPNFRGVNGYAELQAGNYHENLVEAAVNLPVSDTFAMRVAVHTEVENSFYSLQGTDRKEIPYASDSELDPGNTDERSVRASLLWKPTNNFQFLFKIQYDENNTDGIPYNVNPNSFAPLPGLGCPANGTPPNCHNANYPNYSGSPFVLNYGLPYDKYEYWDRFYLGELRYTFGGGETFRLFAGTEANQTPELDPTCFCGANDGFSLGGTGIGAEPDTNASVEINLISPQQGKFNWIVGAAYVDSNGAFTSYGYTTGPAGPSGTPSPQVPSISSIPAGEETRQAGVFGDLKYNITDTLQFEGGLRGNWDNNYGQGTFNIYPNGTYSCNGVPATNATPCTIPIPTGNLIPNGAGLPYPLYNPRVPVYLNNVGYYHSEHQTFKFGLYWQATPDNYLYVFAAKGYKPGVTQFHAFSTTQPNAQAEVLLDYEVGYKGTYLNHRITTQLDAYYDDYNNMQQNIFNTAAVQNGGLANVPKATIYGAEFNLQMQLPGGFGGNVSAAYTHSDLGSLTSVATFKEPPGFGTAGAGGALPQCAAGVPNSNTCFNYGPYVVNLGGEKAPLAPQFTANITLQYGIRIGDATLQPRVQYSYESSQFFNLLQADNYYEENAHGIWNGYLDFIDGAWRTSLYTTNFTNVLYETFQNGNAVLYGAPLQFGIQATRTF